MCTHSETTYTHDYKNPNLYQTSMLKKPAEQKLCTDEFETKCNPRMVCFPVQPPQAKQQEKWCCQPYKWVTKEEPKKDCFSQQKQNQQQPTCAVYLCCPKRTEPGDLCCNCCCTKTQATSFACCGLNQTQDNHNERPNRFMQQLGEKYPELFDELEKSSSPCQDQAKPPKTQVKSCQGQKNREPVCVCKLKSCCEEKNDHSPFRKPSLKSKCVNVSCGHSRKSAGQWPEKPVNSPRISEYTATISLIGKIIKKNRLHDDLKCGNGNACEHKFILKLKKI